MRCSLVLVALAALAACNNSSSSSSAPPPPKASAEPASLRLGAPIEASAPKVALADVARAPSEYMGKTFATTGTVSAVCQHMGCWMELKDEAGAAHIKMAGHKFFVPKTSAGKKAKVLAKLEKAESEGACEGEGHEGMSAQGGGGGGGGEKKGCRAEAESQLGRPLAKLELVAEGVEIL